MKCSELKQKIDRFRDEDDLVISIQTLHASIGPHSSINVKNVLAGFDWDRGKIIIIPESDLREVDGEFIQAKKIAHDHSEALGFIRNILSNKSLDDSMRIESIKKLLNYRGL